MADTIVSLARREDGRYVAASTTAPFFCFEADTEDAVKQKVESALAFYREAKRELSARQEPARERQITVKQIRPYSRVRRDALAVA